MLRSCIVNLCEKGCTRSLPDKIFIEIVLTNYPLQALLLIIKLYPKIILHEGVRKELCVKILCAVKVMMKIYPLKCYTQKVICIIIFISYSCTHRKNYTTKLSFQEVLGKSCA